MNTALKCLEDKEWSMGNGQCPECGGVPESWHGHPLYLKSEEIGHERNCELAKSLKELGGKPLMMGDYKSEIEYEDYITDSGIYSTRPKTEDGCPRIKAVNDELHEVIDHAMQKFVSALEKDYKEKSI